VLADPQSVTISGTATSLPRIEERAETHVYSNRDAKVDLFVTQRLGKDGINRASITLVQTVTVVDALTGLSRYERPAVTVTLATPTGVALAPVEALYDALTTHLEASTKANLKKIQAGEK
jgi:hypothetical protein